MVRIWRGCEGSRAKSLVMGKVVQLRGFGLAWNLNVRKLGAFEAGLVLVVTSLAMWCAAAFAAAGRDMYWMR